MADNRDLIVLGLAWFLGLWLWQTWKKEDLTLFEAILWLLTVIVVFTILKWIEKQNDRQKR